MNRLLAGIFAVVLLGAGTAQAANLACWMARTGPTAQDTPSGAVGPGQTVVLKWSTAASSTNGDCTATTTTAAGETSKFLKVEGSAISFRLEPQTTGTDTAAQVDVFCCTQPLLTSCTALQWDTDADGLVDDNTLDATMLEKIGTPVFMGCPWVYADPTVNPASGTAELSATGARQ